MARVQLIAGKPDTALEGVFFIATRESPEGMEELLRGARAEPAGSRGDLALWRLPESLDEAGRADLLAAAQALLPVVAPGNPVPQAEPAPAAPPPPPPEGGESGVEEPAPEALPAAPPAGGGDGDDIGYGYRTGMSIAERDLYRRPVPVEGHEVGGMVDTPAGPREIVILSGVLHLGADLFPDMRRRFPDIDWLTPGVDYRLAAWRADPELAVGEMPKANPEDAEEPAMEG